MEVSCTSCPARFAVPDDKVRGRKVRIACKRCGSPIIVDGTHMGAGGAAKPAAGATAAPKPAAGAAAVPKPAASAAATPKPAVGAAPAPKPTAPAAAVPKPAPAAATAPKPAAAAAAKPPATAPARASQHRRLQAGTFTRRSETGSVIAKPAEPKSAASGSADAKSAPAPSVKAATGLPKPVVGGAKPGASSEDENDWSALADGAGKTGAWREPASAVKPAEVPRPAGALSAKKTMLGGLEAPSRAEPPPPAAAPPPAAPQPAAQASIRRTMLGVAPPAAGPPVQRGPEPELKSAPKASESDEPEWTVALTDEHHEEMRTAEVVQLYLRGSIDHETFIWADGMEDWKRPWEIPLIATALAARGLKEPHPDEDDFPPFGLDEPAEEDATIVAAMAISPPPSARGKVPSGVWHEPGRAEADIGFEDVTVSLDGQSAQALLESVGARVPQKSRPEVLASQFEDIPTRVEEASASPTERPAASDVDDLLSDMDDPTMALEDSFQAMSRPMSSVPDLGDDDETTTIEKSALAGQSLDALFGSPRSDPLPPLPSLPTVPERKADLFDGLDLGAPEGRDRPLDSLWEPTGIQRQDAAPPPIYAPQPAPYAGASGAYPAQSAPFPSSLPSPPRKSSGGLGWLFLLFFVLVLGAAAGLSYYFKQPPMLYGPDGRPKIPGLR
ncbi:MAG: DUF4339 domain-containing protein [Polyangiaceae bacterium]